MVSLCFLFIFRKKGELKMNAKLNNFVKTSKGFLAKHSPEILTGIGVTGMITSTVLAVKATPKALFLLEEAADIKEDRLTTIEVVKTAWKQYVPAAVIGLVGVSCIVGASTVNTKRNAALATAYAISEKTLLTYKDKVIETIGEKKEKEIRGKVAQDNIDANPVSNSKVIVTSKGETLCKDSLSGRYFKSDLAIIMKAVNELNRDMINHNYVSLNELYDKIGLDSIKNGDRLGWNLDDGLIEIDYDACLSDEGEPCLYIDYTVPPKYDFDRIF